MENTTTPRISIKMQYWLFKKQKSSFWLLIVFLLAGIYGLYQGFAFKQKQRITIETFREDRTKKFAKTVEAFAADTTKPESKMALMAAKSAREANWATNLPTFKTPVSTAIFCIGQADVFPYYYNVKIESFFMQLFKQGEINNPLRSLAGHFDVSFWVIYLLPLLIIVLLFNALSAELDNGNWRLVNAQGISAKQWLGSKFLWVGLLLEGLVLVVFLGGIIVNFTYFKQTPSLSDLLFFVGVNLYLIFWLSVVYLINSFGKNTSNNALFSGISWTVVCIIMPMLFSMISESIIEVDNTVVSRMSRRPQGSKFEDEAFGIKTIKELGELNPKYKNAVIDPKSRSFKFSIYTAYHELLDDTNKVAVQQYFDKIEQRQNITNASTLLNPTAAIDGIFANLAQNDAAANHQFVWQTKALHGKLHDAYFPVLFFNKSMQKADYERFPVFESNKNTSITGLLWLNYVVLIGLILSSVYLANRNLTKLFL